MADRLGLAVIPGMGWSAREIQAVAREAEDAGFDAIFAAEVNNDVMATAQLMGAATRRIQVGTWIANIYLRHSYTCAQGAALIADAHRRTLHPRARRQPSADQRRPRHRHAVPARRRCAATSPRCGSWLRGEGPATHLPQRPPRSRCPSTWPR